MQTLSVSITPKNNSIITQSNRLTEARYTLTLAEQRLVITLLSFISPDDEDFKDYEIKVSDFKSLVGSNTNSIYDDIRNTLQKLATRVIYMPKGAKGYEIVNWFSYASYDDEEHKVIMRFDKSLKPYLLKLKEQFTQYKLFTITQFHSSYTVRIYMLLKQYEKIGYRELELKEFRYMLDIKEKEYTRFQDFKKRIINQAKKEFEKKDEHGHLKSDITFDLETIRTGRKITRLRFNIRKQKYQEQLPFDIPEAEPLTPTIQALIDHKISENHARRFEAEQGSDEVLRCIAQYEKKVRSGKVDDTNGGYLLAMLEGRAGKQSKAELDAQEQQEKKQIQKQEKAEEEATKKAFEQAQKELISQFLDGLDEAQQAQLIEDFEASELFKVQVKNNIFVSSRYKSDGVKAVMVAPHYKRFIKDYYLPEEYRDIEQWKALKG